MSEEEENIVEKYLRRFKTYNNAVAGNTANHNLYGISFLYCNNNQVTNNTANSNINGINLSTSNYNNVSGNTANMNSKCGIYLSDGDYTVITWNTINGNDDGVYFYHSYNNGFAGNTVNYKNYGIHLYYSVNNDLIENTVNDNHIGLFLSNSDYNTISDNAILYNYECWREYNCEGNIFEDNECEVIRPFPYFNIPNILMILIGFHAIIGILVLMRYVSKRSHSRKYRNGIETIIPSKPIQQTPQTVTASTKFCTRCGAPIIEGDLYCSNCGVNLNA